MMSINEIATDAGLREQIHLKDVDQLGRKFGYLNSTSNWLFVLAIGLGFPAVFTTSLLGLVPLGFAIMGVFVVWYRSKADIPREIEMNVWFANRYWSIHQECLKLHSPEIDSHIDEFTRLINDKYKGILNDFEAYSSGQKTAVIRAFDDELYERQRRSAALGNKYNKHEIKQFM